MDNLKELYIDQMQDTYSANKQANEVFSELKDAACNNSLKDILQKSIDHTTQRNNRLADIIKGHKAEPSGEHCKGMEGLIKEAKKHALKENFSCENTQDAQIIAQYQRISHYGIAAYGTIRAFAKQLGLAKEATTFKKDLEDLYDGDSVMTSIAEGEVNQKAAA